MKKNPCKYRRLLSMILALVLLVTLALPNGLVVRAAETAIVITPGSGVTLPKVRFIAPEAVWLKQAVGYADTMWGFASLQDAPGAGLSASADVTFGGDSAKIISITGFFGGKQFVQDDGATLTIAQGDKLPDSVLSNSTSVIEWIAKFTLDGFDGTYTAKTYTAVYAPSNLGAGTIGSARANAGGIFGIGATERVGANSIVGVIGLHNVTDSSTNRPNGNFVRDFINMDFSTLLDWPDSMYAPTSGDGKKSVVRTENSGSGNQHSQPNNANRAADNIINVDISRFDNLNQIYGLKAAFRLTRAEILAGSEKDTRKARLSIAGAASAPSGSAEVGDPYTGVKWQSTGDADAMIADGWNVPLAGTQDIFILAWHQLSTTDNNRVAQVSHTNVFRVNAVDKSNLRTSVLAASADRAPDEFYNGNPSFNTALMNAVLRLGNPVETNTAAAVIEPIDLLSITLTLEGYGCAADAAANQNKLNLEDSPYENGQNVIRAEFNPGDGFTIYAPKMIGWDYYMSHQLPGTQVSFDGALWEEGAKSENVVGAVDVTIKYTQSETARVRFDTRGGSASTAEPKIVRYQELYGSLPQTERHGYGFEGWFTSAVGGTKIMETTPIDILGNHTLYAQWRPITSTVTFDPNGGNTPRFTSKRVSFDALYGSLPTVLRTGYELTGWFTDANGGDQIAMNTVVQAVADHTLYAQWTTVPACSVTFDAHDGSPAPSPLENVQYNSPYGTLPLPTRAGYTFDGWYTAQTGGTRITAETLMQQKADHTLHARWTAVSGIVVSFDSAGGSTPATLSKSTVFGKAYGTLPAVNRAGYAFDGWFTAQTGGALITAGDLVANAEDHTLYAQWIPVSPVHIDFVTDIPDMPTPDPIVLEYNAPYGDLPQFPRVGYVVGWFTEAQGGTRATPETLVNNADSHTLYARWMPITGIVSFDGNGGGTPSFLSRTVAFDATYTVLPTISRVGYVFLGWFTQPDGGIKIDADTQVALIGDHTLYACWESTGVSVTFYPMGGTSNGESKIVVLGQPYGALPEATRASYVFCGWFTQPDGGVQVTAETIVTNNGPHVLYAQWRADDGSVDTNAPVLIGGNHVTLAYKTSMDLSNAVSGSDLRWSSNNSSVVSVDEITGVITSHKTFWKIAMGATITAKNDAGEVQLEVTVPLSFWEWLMTILLFGWVWY
ncbi:MAG: InlB B-repeat-containing protein [Oscillospiraceae bacterium]|jgi:uncharacterized repeat protein (TIGR02543 family)|nr:InlB B-repeat-containing protein [Oscillospiraceae bacterium]